MSATVPWLTSLLFVGAWIFSRGVQVPRTQCISQAKHPDRFRNEWRNTAFVIGGMGKYGDTPGIRKCMALAESLRRVGGWQGNVYILTDAELDSKTKSKLHKGNPNVGLRVIDPIRGGVDFRNNNAGGGGGYLKTMIFDLPDVPEDILIWHDCDKLIAEPDCINNMFGEAALDFGPSQQLLLGSLPKKVRDCENCPEKPVCTNTSWGQYEGRCGDGIHVGVFAAHRKWSKKIIEAWKKQTQDEPAVYDRYTLWAALEKLDLLGNVSHLPTPFKDHMWNKGDVGCVNHISGPRAWDKNNAGALVPLLESMCLKSCTGKQLTEVYANCLKWKNGKVVLDPRMPEAWNLKTTGETEPWGVAVEAVAPS